MPDNSEEIDEQLRSEHAVDFFFARCISAHQSLQRAGLVWRVMIDMQIGKVLQTLHHEIDEPHKNLLFIRTCKSPIRRVGLCAVLVPEGVAEQIFEATFADEWIALEIQEDVTG